jgi:Tol biopolymer transport system component
MVAPDSAGGDNVSDSPSISANGRYVAFDSAASNLVGRDTNDSTDVFVRDLARGVTRLVSASSTGVQGNGSSINPSISADGRYVAFESDASNLTAADANGTRDVFVRDRFRRVTRLISTSSSEEQALDASFAASISGDGRFVAFESFASNLVGSDANGVRDVFVRDRTRGTTRRMSVSSSGVEADLDSHLPSISADGRFVVFESTATNLVAGDTNGFSDVFRRDRADDVTRRMSVNSDGLETDGDSFNPVISGDGHQVLFESDATNLVSPDTNDSFDVFVRGR